jgi:hypothetical protein
MEWERGANIQFHRSLGRQGNCKKAASDSGEATMQAANPKVSGHAPSASSFPPTQLGGALSPSCMNHTVAAIGRY